MIYTNNNKIRSIRMCCLLLSPVPGKFFVESEPRRKLKDLTNSLSSLFIFPVYQKYNVNGFSTVFFISYRSGIYQIVRLD